MCRTKLNPSLYFAIVFGLIMSGLITSGCSKRDLKRAGLRYNTIKLKDLGSDFKGLRNSPKDPFRETKGARPIRIKYKSFKLKKFDQFIKQVNILYARYRLSKRLTANYHREVDQLLKTDLKGQSRAALRRSLRRKTLKNTKVVKRLSASYDALLIAFKSTRGLVKESKRLSNRREGVANDALKRLKAHPEKVILTNDVLQESERSLKRLKEIISGTPKLLKSLSKGLEFSKLATSFTRAR